MSARIIQLILEGTDRASPEIRQVRGGVQGLGGDVKSLTSLAVRAGGALGLAFGAREISQFFLNTTRETQRLNAQLETFEGSQARANALFRDFEQFASDTPGQIQEWVNSYVRLRAIGLEPTAKQLTAFGDIAAANSKETIQFIESVNDAATFEFERLKEFGIKVNQEGEKLRFTFRGKTETIAKDSQAVIDLLTEIGETEFAGGMARQMDTIDGAVSNLFDNLATLVRIIGDAGLTGEIQGATAWVRDFTGDIVEHREEIGKWTRVALEAGGFAIDVLLFVPRIASQSAQAVAAIIITTAEGIKGLADLGRLELAKRASNVLIGLSDPLGIFEFDERLKFETQEGGLANFRAIVAGLPELLRENVGGAFSIIDELAQSWADVAIAAEVAGHAQQGAAGLLDGNSGRIGSAGAGTGSGGAPSIPDLPSRQFAGQAFFDVMFNQPDGPQMLDPEGLRLSDASAAMRDAYLADLDAMQERTAMFAESVRQDMLFGVVGTFEMLGSAVVGGLGDFEDAIGAMGGHVAGILGDMMINAGTTIVLTSGAFKAFKDALQSLVPEKGIAAGLLLIAAGSAIKSGVGSFLSNPSGGGGGSSSGLSSFSELRSGSGGRVVNVYLPEGGIINMNDFRQREEFKAAIKEIVGTGEVQFHGA